MNAITELPAAEAALELIPISSIRVSRTAVQTLRREHNSAEKLLELAASIASSGVLQPILVRPVPVSGTIKYEIVAGERRWRAADRAGLAHIPCIVRDCDDRQTLQAQLVENTAREEYSALEEATGFREMLALEPGLTAETLGARLGKSRSYVYARLKLLDLIPAAQQALADGSLDASKGLIIARIQGEKMQARALHLVTTQAHYYSYRRLIEKLRDDFMIPIAQAAWLPDRDSLHLPKTGEPIITCAGCPSRSVNDPELHAEVTGSDVCTDRACFDLKTRLHWSRIKADYEAQGHTVATGAAVDDYIDTSGLGRHCGVHNNYLRMDFECDTIEFAEAEPDQIKGEPDDVYEMRSDLWQQRCNAWQAPTFASLLGTVVGTQLVQGRDGSIIEVAPAAAVVKALQAKGIEVPWFLEENPRGSATEADNKIAEQRASAEAVKESERIKIEAAYRARLLAQIHAEWKPPLKRHDLESIAWRMEYAADDTAAFDALYTANVDITKLKEPELQRYMVIYAISGDCLYDRWTQHKCSRLLDYAQRLKIDTKKLRAEVVKGFRLVLASAKPEAQAAAKKKGVGK